MKVRCNIWLAIAIPFAAIIAAQTTSDQGLDANITKLPSDPFLAPRSEMQTLTPHTAIEDQRDEIRSLRRQVSKLVEANTALQASICSCPKRKLKMHAAFKKPGLLANSIQTDSSFSADVDIIPLLMGFEKSTASHLSIDPQHMDPKLPTASPPHKESDMLTAVRARAVLNRERMVYCIILTLAATYISTLVFVFLKTTADAKLRKRKERSSRNAALDYWKTRHKQERDLKALNEERHQLRLRHELRQLKKQKAADADARKYEKTVDAAAKKHEKAADAEAKKHDKDADAEE